MLTRPKPPQLSVTAAQVAAFVRGALPGWTETHREHFIIFTRPVADARPELLSTVAVLVEELDDQPAVWRDSSGYGRSAVMRG